MTITLTIEELRNHEADFRMPLLPRTTAGVAGRRRWMGWPTHAKALTCSVASLPVRSLRPRQCIRGAQPTKPVRHSDNPPLWRSIRQQLVRRCHHRSGQSTKLKRQTRRLAAEIQSRICNL